MWRSTWDLLWTPSITKTTHIERTSVKVLKSPSRLFFWNTNYSFTAALQRLQKGETLDELIAELLATPTPDSEDDQPVAQEEVENSELTNCFVLIRWYKLFQHIMVPCNILFIIFFKQWLIFITVMISLKLSYGTHYTIWESKKHHEALD
jgi:hypothetical protein